MVQDKLSSREQVLFVAAKSFLEKGYTNTTLRYIAKQLDATVGIITAHFPTKENILCELVQYVIEKQFDVTEKLIHGKTDDKILMYAAETVLQLHIVESNENLRDLYSNAYSLPKTSAILQKTITGKLEGIFKKHLPQLETKDFYMLEIATGGIMRGFMTVPCDMWFTMEQKVGAFLDATLLIYRVPKEKIEQAKTFVRQFDFETIAASTVSEIVKNLSSVE